MLTRILIFALVSLLACKPDPVEPPTPVDEKVYTPTITLKDKATFPVGAAVQANRLNLPSLSNLVKKEFNSLTAEYEMKQNIFMPAANTYNWAPADAIVNFAVANGMRVHGHALIWHSAVPDWVTNFAGSDAEFETMIRNYITTVVTRYKGKVASWDVVNEGISDNGGTLRNTIFRERMGDDYIAKCFQWARDADPDVLLFYNDYNAEFDQTKRTAIINLINDFKSRGVPIDGFGFQMHINHDAPSMATLTTAVDQVKNTGVKIHFSELDVRVNPNKDLTTLTLARAQSQEARYKAIAELHKSLPANQQFGITVWGIYDDESWLINFWGNIDWPLLFTGEGLYKISHRGFVDGL